MWVEFLADGASLVAKPWEDLGLLERFLPYAEMVVRTIFGELPSDQHSPTRTPYFSVGSPQRSKSREDGGVGGGDPKSSGTLTYKYNQNWGVLCEMVLEQNSLPSDNSMVAL
ncbi:hypothetical protein N7447_010484 [Penicillium robsamsonii]|uniref:uncharacterized protein n=1 Tax=Penicillium robsamsonii TaxID=1792511 RepID=UPI002549AA86|nr:uncharacterized protein N7447_010484 [Penicillium robsamsonii]KAJ5810968.1 hypothetical protein N7447_010484 [Penicillium robsamsonii]